MTPTLLRALAYVGAGLSVLALANMPYGFYTFLRLALTIVAVVLAVQSHRLQQQGWMWVMIAIAVVWNPLVPVFLDRSVWSVLNIVAAILLAWGGSMLARALGTRS